MRNYLPRYFFVLAIIAVLSLSAFGQVSSSGSLTGTVVDPQGAVVAGAVVTVKSVSSQEFTAVTNGEGVFTIPALADGVYSATIVAKGFKTAAVTDIKINVGTPSSIKVALEIGAESQTVTIVGGGELVQTQSATVGTSITGRQITELPYASRNALDLLLFLPGTSTAGRPRQSTVNGLPKSMLNITMDGINIQDNVLKGSDGFFTIIQPKTDAVQEVSVSTSTPGAESNAEGAVQIKFTTRHGGSDFHGSAYWTHRDKSLNGNFFWNNELLAPKHHFDNISRSTDRAPRTNALLNQPGGRIGGPMIIPHILNKGKAFFFINYEEYRLPEAQLRTRTVLSPNAVAGNFQFGATTVNVLTLAAANGFISTVDPTIAALLASTRSVPGSYTATSDPNIQQLSFTNQGGQKRQFPTARFDFEITKNHHVETIYNYQIFRSKVDFLNGADPFAPGFPNFGSQDSNRYSSATAWRWTIKSNLVNEARVGVQNGIVLFFPQNNPGQFVNQGGVSQGIGAAASGISNVTTVNNAQRRNTPTKQLSDNLSWIKGKHTLNFGGDVSSIDTFLQQTPNFVGVVPTVGYGQDGSDAIENIFCVPGSSPNTCGPFTTATIAAQADTLYRVLTGRITSISYAASLNEAGTGYVRDVNTQRFRQREIGFYGQDSWRFRPNLTLNFGLRLETVYAPISRNKALTQNTFAGLFGTSGTDLSALFKPGATGGTATSFTPLPEGQHLYQTAHNLAPTFGFAYQPNFKHGILRRLGGSSGQTVLRGGWSMAFDREGLNLTSSIVGTNFGGQRDLTQFAGTDFPRGTLFRNFPAAPATPGVPVYPLVPTFTDNASANAFTPNLKTPYVISFSGSIQRELNKDTVLEVGYVGNRGHQLLRQFNVNEVNIIENGFANEFDNARKNLLANIAGGCGTTFKYSTCAGTVPLPLFLAFFQGSSANANLTGTYTSSRFASTTFTSRMVPGNLQAIGTAGVLAARGNVSANTCVVPPGLTPVPCPYMQNATNALLAGNFFVVNPVELNNFGAGNGSEVRRRMAKGLLASFNYTFAKAQGNEYVSSSIAFLQPATIRNTWLNKTNSPFDIRQSLKGSYIYELPVGRGKKFMSNSHGLVNAVAGDWTLNGTLRVSSGVPLNMGNIQIFGMTPKQLEDSIRIRKTPDHLVFWLPQDVIDNTRRAFNVCLPGTAGCTANGYGTANLTGGLTGGDPSGRYFAPAGDNCISRFTGQCGFTHIILHGPQFARADLGIEKKFKLSESKNIELRFEFLNVLNNTDFRLGSYNSDTVTIGAAGVPTFTNAGFGQILGSDTAYRDVSTTNDPGGRIGQVVFRFNF
ncbi:MAG: hypothetical protein DMF70_01865 [Acidobacteria bacterium]|nr:MAG: hypothetical protein DMF70_01865 [Acidobacteriota bacterium]